MDTNYLIIFLSVIFCAGFLQSLSGFGFCLVAVPVLTMFMETKTVVPLLLILTVFVNASVTFKSRKHLEIKPLWPVILFGVMFMPLGALFLVTLNDGILKAVVGAVTIVFSLLLLAGIKLKVRNEKLWLFPIGALSGLLGGSVSLNGPPLVVFFAGQNTLKHSFRTNMTAYFLIVNMFTIPVYFASGLIDFNTLRLSAQAVIPLFAGVLGGMFVAEKVTEKFFNKIVLILILITGTMVAATALLAKY